jgi:hypothetical protein
MILYCCVCGKRLMNAKGRGGNPKYPCCGDPDCKKEVTRQRTRDSQKAKRLRVTKDRLAGIEKMKSELDTKEKFLKATYGRGGSTRIARQYKVNYNDVGQYREELFADMTPAEIRGLRKKVIDELPREVIGKKPEVKVYKIVDKAKFEAGGPGTYDGLKFDRLEYPEAFDFPFNARLGGIEMTRIERIRNMTIEEMAEKIIKKNITNDYCKGDCNDECDDGFVCPHELECCIQWLESEVEHDA